MSTERIVKLTPEEKERRLNQKRKERKRNYRINLVFLSVTVLSFIFLVISLINYSVYAIPQNNTDKEINAAKEAIAGAEAMIKENSTEKDALMTEIDGLKAEYEKYQDD